VKVSLGMKMVSVVVDSIYCVQKALAVYGYEDIAWITGPGLQAFPATAKPVAAIMIERNIIVKADTHQIRMKTTQTKRRLI
jgi:hypothetical protein